MKIGGLHKLSLSDYPGKVAAVVFTQGCNFKCPWCHNASLVSVNVPNDSLIPEEKVFEFLENRRSHLDVVVVTGGEPTIQPDLPEFIHRIITMGFLVKLDTNGSRPKVLRKLLKQKLIDYVAMDIKAPLDIYDRLTGVQTPIDRIKKSIELIASSGITHVFRTTVVKSLLLPQDLRPIQKLIPPGSMYLLQKFRPEYALDPVLQTYTIPPRFSGDK
jgi:pyruvate formate lyase activating enzyme